MDAKKYNPKIDPDKHGQLISDKGTKAIQWKRTVF
jgi:hypothetical protein